MKVKERERERGRGGRERKIERFTWAMLTLCS